MPSRSVPDKEAFGALAKQGNLVPVYREIVADGDTPVSAYQRLGRREHGFILESVVGGEKWAAYSFVGAGPRGVLTARGSDITLRWSDLEGDGSITESSWQSEDPVAALAEVLARHTPVAIDGLPRFWGGAVGWLGYDVVRAIEKLPDRHEPSGLPDACFVFTDTLVIFDNLRQTMKVVATAHVPDGADVDASFEAACRRIDEVIARLAKPASLSRLPVPPASEAGTTQLRFGGGVEPTSPFSREAFSEAVDRVKEYIRAGDAFQIVLSQRLEVPAGDVDPFDVYRALRVVNPSPYMFFLEFAEAQVVGASPEALVRLEGRRMEVRPLAGTRPRGRDAADDARLAEELLADPKERAEHIMLVDLGRNDVGRVATTGSVRVENPMSIERYSHVMHIVSSVVGELAEGNDAFDVLRAVFPAGTLSGAPKIRAMEIIEELEPHRRGIYGGAVGYFGYGGNMDLAIAIRTLVAAHGRIFVQSGAGLVADSDPAMEYEETLNKARAVLRAVALAREAEAR